MHIDNKAHKKQSTYHQEYGSLSDDLAIASTVSPATGLNVDKSNFGAAKRTFSKATHSSFFQLFG